jgi:putative transposase
MPRLARIVIPNLPHHITQRGNNRAEVFFEERDYRFYLKLLKQYAEKHDLEVHAYCLMKNHVHLVATPLKKESMAITIGRTHHLYAQYINERYERNGHLWQGRFYSTVLDEGHFWQAIRYIERNPVQADYCRQAWNYPWSSAAVHVGTRKTDILVDLEQWRDKSAGMDWQAHLSLPQDKDTIVRLRSNTHTGRPLGKEDFITRLEEQVGRSLRPPPMGRPRKQQNLNGS